MALATAVRIEPALMRTVRLTVRPSLDVGAESALWYGPWAAHRGAQYMAFRRPTRMYVRQLLVAELRASVDGDPIRLAGDTIAKVHTDTSSVLALEEAVTWAALLTEAGVEPTAIQEVNRWFESALHAAVKQPHRRDGLRRWFTQAWERLPQGARETSSALDLHEILAGPTSISYAGSGVFSTGPRGVSDIVLPVRHDGSKITFGDPLWPADGILVPDTQPRILHVNHSLHDWQEATEVRVPRRGKAAAPATHVPMYVRTAAGHVYRIGAPGGSEVIDRPLPHHGSDRPLLGQPVRNLKDRDYLHFGIPPSLVELASQLPVRSTADHFRSLPPEPPSHPLPDFSQNDARLNDMLLEQHIRQASGLIAVRGHEGTGRANAAWRAMRRALPPWWVWVPSPIDRNRAILRALASDGIGSQTIVWLDDLDTDLLEPKYGESLAEALLDLLEDPGRRPVLIIATLREGTAYEGRLGPAATALLRTARILDLPMDAEVPGKTHDQDFCPRPRPPASLPEPHPQMLGREPEIQRMVASLDEQPGRVPCAAITGMAGSGTTTLAIQTADTLNLLGRFQEGILFVRLGGTRRAPWTVILNSLNHHVATRGKTTEHLRVLCTAQLMLIGSTARPVLMILDDATPTQLRDVLAVLPSGYAVLATSHQYLPVPPEHVAELGVLTEDASVQILQHHLEQANPDDPRLRKDSESARAIADACGHLPLALAAAASQLSDNPAMLPAELLQALLQEGPPRPGSFKGATVQASFDRAFLALSRPLRTYFGALSWLPGLTFSLHTADTLLSKFGDTKTILMQLRARFLILSVSLDRWRIHPLWQEYGRSASVDLLDADDYTENRDLILTYFRERTKTADSVLRSQVQEPNSTDEHSFAEALKWFDAEHENIVALAVQCFDSGVPRSGVEISMRVAQYLYQSAKFTDLLMLMEHAYAWTEEIGDNDVRTRVLNNLAVSSAAMGDFQRARGFLITAAELSYTERQREDYLQMLSSLGAVLLRSSQTSEAIEVLTDAISQHDQDKPNALFSLLCNLGAAFHRAGKIQRAIQTLERAERLASQYPIGPADKVTLHRNLAEAFADTDRTEGALRHYGEALECHRQTGNRAAQAKLHADIGELLSSVGRSVEALGHFQHAAIIHHNLGNDAAEAEAVNLKSLILFDEQAYDAALEGFINARELFQMANDEVSAVTALNDIGNVLLLLHRYDEAIPALRNASAHLEAIGDQNMEAQALHRLGLAYLKTGDVKRSQVALHRSALLYQQLLMQEAPPIAMDATGGEAMDKVEARARQENQMLDQARSLRGDLLELSHTFTASGDEGEAAKALDTALEIENALRNLNRYPTGSP
ncbi:tetratricopeptide repeat protein [Streptomyces tauricus]|uniref:tetratricopeptide repeat protein n=1 Tax=Streptomyces tauricus TaxID=68274 RepID=UPI0033B349A4